MQEKLVIYLHADALHHPSWVVVNEQGDVQHVVHHGDLADLTAHINNKIVILLVPTQDVLLTSVALPKMNHSRLLQAVPFALEEQLISDLDSMHFALGERVDDVWPVLAVSHERMQTWLALMQTHQIPVDMIIPAVLALPTPADDWQIYAADLALIRMQVFQGLTTELNQLDMVLKHAIKTTEQLPANIKLSNYTETNFDTTMSEIALIETRLPQEKFIQDLALNLDENKLINLLQGQYALKKAKRPAKNKSWRPIMYLGSAWLALLLAYPLVSYIMLKHRLNVTSEEMLTVYQHQFPGASSMIAPKLRMEEKWQKLTSAAGENRVLLLLGYVGKGIQVNKGVKLNRADFQNNQLTLELTAASSDEMTALTNYLTQQGLSVKQQNVNFAGARVNATLQIQ